MRTCMVCGAPGAAQWSLFNGREAGVAYLCVRHEGPLVEALKLAGSAPREDDMEVPAEDAVPQRVIRKKAMEPLAWSPPN